MYTSEQKQGQKSSKLSELFAGCSDFCSHELLLGERAAKLCWLDGLVSAELLTETVLRPLSRGFGEPTDALLRSLVYASQVKRRETSTELAEDLCLGCCALVAEGEDGGLSFEVRGGQQRAVAQPTLEKSLKGGKDSFVEALRANTALLRQRLRSPDLKIAETSLGRRSHTRSAVLYLEGITSPALVRELAARLSKLDVDAVLATGLVEEAVAEAPRSPFPQLLHTERPDRLAQWLTDGRVGLLIDGIPLGLAAPASLADFLKVESEQSSHFLVSSLLSLLRFTALLLSLLLPAVYVAMSMYHQEMIPTKLLLSMIEAKQNVPFSTALEVLGMMLSFLLLEEAGLRLPEPVGNTVSIIGALIVGQSAVEAQLVSPIAIIVVAVAGIAVYAQPSRDLASALRLGSFVSLLFAAAAGLFGVGVFCCLLLWHLAGIDSFSLSYLSPLSEGGDEALLRVLFRRPLRARRSRDLSLHPLDRRRQS